MPGFDGLELIRGVRYLSPDVPIVLMTGYGSDLIRDEAGELGVNDYVEKPFDVSDLLQVVRDLLRGRRGGDRWLMPQSWEAGWQVARLPGNWPSAAST